MTSNQYKNLSDNSEKSEKKFNLSKVLLNLETQLSPIFEFLNENEFVIRASGNMWNRVFDFFNNINKLKKSLIDSLDIPKSEELWKSIYESEKSNLINHLNQIINRNNEKFRTNSIND